MTLTRDPDTWPTGDAPPFVLTCPECESVHFNVRPPLQFSDIWQICCEGCGAIYNLLPSGEAQLHSR
jgi:hypothetical protein